MKEKEKERKRGGEHALGILAPASVFNCFQKMERSNGETFDNGLRRVTIAVCRLLPKCFFSYSIL